jgi:3-methyladenine DNA glycosylase AlkD
MTIEKILADLKALGDPRAIAVWKRVGMNTDNYFGVGLTKLKEYAKRLKKDHDLALELWATKNHDARLLATIIEEPAKATSEQIDRWVGEADFWDLTNKIVSNVVAKTSFGKEKMTTWMKSKKELIRRAGFMTLVNLAKSDDTLSESEFAGYLDLIEKKIQGEDNWVREAMNYAVIAIGSRNGDLNRKAQKTATKIGKVEIDYGESSCQAPDAIVYLKKAAAKLK